MCMYINYNVIWLECTLFQCDMTCMCINYNVIWPECTLFQCDMTCVYINYNVIWRVCTSVTMWYCLHVHLFQCDMTCMYNNYNVSAPWRVGNDSDQMLMYAIVQDQVNLNNMWFLGPIQTDVLHDITGYSYCGDYSHTSCEVKYVLNSVHDFTGSDSIRAVVTTCLFSVLVIPRSTWKMHSCCDWNSPNSTKTSLLYRELCIL